MYVHLYYRSQSSASPQLCPRFNRRGLSLLRCQKDGPHLKQIDMLDQITFDQLPSAIATILDDLAELKEICNDIRGRSDLEAYLTIEELQAYHPDHPSRTTIHRWKRDGYLPFYRDPVTRRTKFKKSEIDALIEASRHMTRQEENAIRDAMILAKRHQIPNDYDQQ